MSKRKFNVGDKVIVVRKYGKEDFDHNFKINQMGIVDTIECCATYPYYIRRLDGVMGAFAARELELVK